LIVRIDKVMQYLDFRFARVAYELSEVFVLQPGAALRDMAWPGACSVRQLPARLEMPSKLRAAQEHIDAEVHLMSEPPGGKLSEIFERCHTA
jgi:hypothetical protein